MQCIVYCLNDEYMMDIKLKKMYVMFNCKCLCCPKIGITQDQYRLIAKGLEDLAFTCSRCHREAMVLNK